MNTERMLELAGMKKAIGPTTSMVLNEAKKAPAKPSNAGGAAAKEYIRSLDIYKELMKDTKAKPDALKIAKQFVDDYKNDTTINKKAKDWVHDQLHDIAQEHNPRGAMLSKDDDEDLSSDSDDDDDDSSDEKKASNAKTPDPVVKKAPSAGRQSAGNKKGVGRKAASSHRAEAQSWHKANPNATAAEFKAQFAKIYDKHNPDADPETRSKALNGARMLYYNTKKKLSEFYVVRQSNSKKILSERSTLISPNWIGYNDFSADFLIARTLNDARKLRESVILHSDEPLEIVRFADDSAGVKKSLA